MKYSVDDSLCVIRQARYPKPTLEGPEIPTERAPGPDSVVLTMNLQGCPVEG